MEAQTALQTGDIVYLNSGSPDLKVVVLSGDQVEVEWQGETVLEQAVFPVVCIRTAKGAGISN